MVFDEGLTKLTANNFVASSTANLGNVGNVTITGGSANYVLTTDGAGNLTWSAASGASAIAVQEEGVNVVAAANTINFVVRDKALRAYGESGPIIGYEFEIEVK